ncbi:tRNA (adenosine(37)-N6)-threonylcarbamoyltransferase complex ATPase subunit type 1 TsaE [Candidatus Steffania adelgidicola]|uniref:tRNA (adenosine(37)-N6)-threonylcarbamoyltransferase complex ATPase subunit type 1 TsaE n=1 Tax=Candidatus Steffania adelgidicola TaxID=1076626 RepID=UPI001D012091|nr:tRNA (adenosine(37)-N6)-threonylcarbamoyltransferase complex ATPase subunit type 1 TsaE [Candidatus Steffania adelgidicola]UDG79507.1 tRNA threonylcarbamoyladenosine biosynthesis protein TsaE [Candidatus Steffania adelgidicola]
MENCITSLSNKLETISLGAALAIACQRASIIYLYGDLGTGKNYALPWFSKCTRIFRVYKSPTYTLVESYFLPYWTVYHFDLYRLSAPEELEFIGVRDYFNEATLCLVEWPQRGGDVLPAGDISLTLQYQKDSRQTYVTGLSTVGNQILVPLRRQGTFL